MDASETKNKHSSYNSNRDTIGMSRYRKNVLRYVYNVLRCIAIFCFHYIFSKIHLISPYLPSFEPYVIESELNIYIHSKMCNVRLPYVKHALNVRYKTYVKRMDRAPYV